jgi:peptidoglycan/LPS O-acetylase OafA/YrhL
MSLHFQSELGGVPLRHSYLAVDFFFILSGFVLAHAYEDRLLGGMTPTQFLHLRLIRLYPLYLIGTLIGLASATAVGNLDWSKPISFLSIISALFFLPDLSFRDHLYPLNSPAWSLFFELTANAAYAIALRCLTNQFLFLLAVLSLAILIGSYPNVTIGWDWANFIGGFPRVSFGFFAGVLTYRIWSTAKWRPCVPQWAPEGLAIVLFLSFAVGRSSSWHDRYDYIALLVFPFLVYCGACREPLPRNRPIFLWLGSISYALYITHRPLMQSAEFLSQSFFQIHLAAAAPWAGLGIGAIAVMLAALFSRIDPVLRRVLLGDTKSEHSIAVEDRAVGGKVYGAKGV